MPARDSDWHKFLYSLPLCPDANPVGYVTLSEFGRLIGVQGSAIMTAVKKGILPRRHCITVESSVKKRRTLLINWNASGYDYVMTRPMTKRPKGFSTNKKHEFKPFDLTAVIERPESEKIETEKPPQIEPAESTDLNYETVIDIASAKYRVEQLKIEKMQAELKLANNEVVPMEQVIAHERELALEIKASIRKSENKMAPLLAQANTVLECRAIMEAYHREAFESLKPLETDNGEAEKNSSNG